MSEEHNCANCKDKDKPYTEPPCEECLEYGTRYPYWKVKE